MKPTFFALFFLFTAFLLLNNSASVFSAPVTTVTTPPPSASPKANLTLEELIRQLYPSIDHLPENPCTPNMTAAVSWKKLECF